MEFSKRAQFIKASLTLSVTSKAKALKAKGENVINFAGGEPDFDTPQHIKAAAIEAINEGFTKYTPSSGASFLIDAIIDKFRKDNNIEYNQNQVVVSCGAKHSLFNTIQILCDKGDEVIIPSPYWVSYPEMVKLCGAVPVPVPAEDGSFYPRIEDIEQNLTGYTKAIIINSPNNPSGAVYAPQFIEDIIKLAEKESIYLIFDDIYNRLIFDGVQVTNPYDISTDDTDNSRLIVVNGISKPYAMTGFRIGWAVASRKLIEVMTNIQAHQTSGPSVLLQKAAIGAINGNQTGVESLRETLQNNTKVMIDQLNAFDGVHVSPPDGTFYVFADFSYYDKASEKLAKFLLDKVRVVTVPGAEFGFDGYLRLSTCTTIKDITEGIERIKWALDPNSPNELYIGERKLVRDWL